MIVRIFSHSPVSFAARRLSITPCLAPVLFAPRFISVVYHSPLEGESQKPSLRRRLMRWGDDSKIKAPLTSATAGFALVLLTPPRFIPSRSDSPPPGSPISRGGSKLHTLSPARRKSSRRPHCSRSAVRGSLFAAEIHRAHYPRLSALHFRYHSPLEGESQKPSLRRRLMRWGGFPLARIFHHSPLDSKPSGFHITPPLRVNRAQKPSLWRRLMRWGADSTSPHQRDCGLRPCLADSPSRGE